MRRPVTALTGRYRLVLVLMARYTKNGFVFSVTAGKHLEGTLMAGGTHFIRCVRCHEHSCRHMGLVAFFTFGGHHIWAVRLVALGTLRNFAVNIVAETTRQFGMFALDLLQLDDLTGMAGQTLISDIVCKLNDFRGMRIIMTTQTAGQVVMGLTGMTLAADRYNLFY